MATLLHLDASAAVEGSRSRALTAAFAAAFAPGDTVVHRDLHAEPVPHLRDPELHWAAPLRMVQRDEDPVQERLVAELLGADAVVIGYPLYNYSLPSSLKAWLDHVHVPGTTAGAVMPLAGKPAVLVTTRGGDYGPGGANAGRDLATPVLELILGEEMGMDVTTVAVGFTLAKTPELLQRSESEYAEALATLEALGKRLGAE
ncbi:NAD(P)H-dependent oxidoreductase [Glycomyces sp. NPDC046736]|uniref:FMN-dependent NADH-azoreductase n=1 Tax=Glycomyces sp. NPDC046736 TaxID=3155615 RepID=UPI0033FA6EFB